MNGKKFWLFAVGLLTGVILCGLFTWLPREQQGPVVEIDGRPTTILAETKTPVGGIAESETPQNAVSQVATALEELAAETCVAWSNSATYLAGDKVLYQGHIYRAKWWTLGERPDAADVWEDTLESPAAPTKLPISPTPTAKQSVASQETPACKNTDGIKVVGYYPSWKSGELEKLRFDVLTHVIYAFAIPTAEGGLRPLENPETARAVIARAHESGAKALLAIGGWSYNDVPLEPTFVSATATKEKRQRFGDAILSLCDSYGFDGVDMDWEHPRTDGESGKQYEQLMLYLAENLHAKGKLLTSAVLSGATPDGTIYYDAAAHSDKVLAAVDWINVMAYDGGDGQRHSTYDFATACGNYWTKTRKLPAAKVVLGMPFYARPSWTGYGELLKADPNAWKSDHILFHGMEAWYNGMATIEKKTKYAAEKLGGVMIWEVTQDTTDKQKSLITAISNYLKNR